MHGQHFFQLAYTWFFFMLFIGKSELNCPQNSAQPVSYSLCPGKSDGLISPLTSFYLSHSKLSDGLTTQKTPSISKTDSSMFLGSSPSDPKLSPPQILFTPDSQPAFLLCFLPAPLTPGFLLPSPSPGTQTRRYKEENSNFGLTIALRWKA